ncbi:MAG: WcaI family glycosyltransferase [Bacteroidota bacterium]
MNILLYGINYAPELTGIGKYSGEMGEWFAEQGHEVKVITAFPYYPNWQIQQPYRGKWWKKERGKAEEIIIRCPLYVPKQPSALKRILHEFSFLFTSSLALLACLFSKKDVIVNVVTPFHLGIPARIFAWLKGIPIVYHIQDLQVDAARDLGMIRSSKLLALMSKMERWILKKADVVSSISEGMIQKIEAKRIDRTKIHFFPNWVDTHFIQPLSKEQSLRKKLGFSPTDRIVLYAGNLGEKQGLYQVIEVANKMQAVDNLHFAIVGEGGVKSQLIQLAAKYQLQNVHFFPLQAFSDLPALLAMADLHLILQKKAAADLVMPSKLTSILAAGGCALITAAEGSSLYQVTSENQLGILTEPESKQALLEGIIDALEQDLTLYQENARQYAEQHLNKNQILKNFESLLKSLISKTSVSHKKQITRKHKDAKVGL